VKNRAKQLKCKKKNWYHYVWLWRPQSLTHTVLFIILLALIFGTKFEPSNRNSYAKEMALVEKNNIIALSLNFTQGLNIFTIAHRVGLIYWEWGIILGYMFRPSYSLFIVFVFWYLRGKWLLLELKKHYVFFCLFMTKNCNWKCT